jgi:hypothetical protein
MADVKRPNVNGYVYVKLSNIDVQWEGILRSSGRSPEALIESFGSYVGQALPGTIFINTGALEWNKLTAVHQVRLAAHEYFHTIQLDLAGAANAKAFYTSRTDAVGVLGPNWLLEGSAEYISWRALQSIGLLDLDKFMSGRGDPTIHPRNIAAFQDFYRRGPESYTASLDAVYHLVKEPGSLSLIAYYWLIGQGNYWQVAFEQAFGLSPEDFYSQFD